MDKEPLATESILLQQKAAIQERDVCVVGEGDEMLMPTQVVRGYARTTALHPSAVWVSGGEGVLTVCHASVRLGRESLEAAVKTRALVAPKARGF